VSASDLLKNFVVDTWYKAFVYLGGAVLAFSLFFDVKGLTNTQLQFLSGGAFLFGLGEWKNHKMAAWIKPPNAYTGGAALMQTTVRKPDLIGVVLDIVGVALVGVGVWRITSGQG
jgi:hypothetical protein